MRKQKIIKAVKILSDNGYISLDQLRVWCGYKNPYSGAYHLKQMGYKLTSKNSHYIGRVYLLESKLKELQQMREPSYFWLYVLFVLVIFGVILFFGL